MESQARIGDVNPYEAPRVVDEVVKTSTIGTIGIDLSTENPFLTIWTRPRATIRGIVNTDPRRYVVPLAMAGGIVHMLERAVGRNAGDTLPLATILLFLVLLGPLSGLIGLHLLGWSLGVTGRWIGGRATWEEVRSAVAWSNVPVIAAGPILISACIAGCCWCPLTIAAHATTGGIQPSVSNHSCRSRLGLSSLKASEPNTARLSKRPASFDRPTPRGEKSHICQIRSNLPPSSNLSKRLRARSRRGSQEAMPVGHTPREGQSQLRHRPRSRPRATHPPAARRSVSGRLADRRGI